MDSGGTAPRWKALRGRVMQTDSLGIATYGSDLFSPTVTSVDMAVAKSLIVLRHVKSVCFVFAPPLEIENRVYTDGRFVGLKMVS
jgi:hypothetical protein